MLPMMLLLLVSGAWAAASRLPLLLQPPAPEAHDSAARVFYQVGVSFARAGPHRGPAQSHTRRRRAAPEAISLRLLGLGAPPQNHSPRSQRPATRPAASFPISHHHHTVHLARLCRLIFAPQPFYVLVGVLLNAIAAWAGPRFGIKILVKWPMLKI